MSLLLPLGLLGLLGVLALVIIYIIRPNYLNKHVSSTYIWRLSLKYRRKRIPVSKLRNFLIFLCQVCILTAIAIILAQPAFVYKSAVDDSDVIAILDSSASMYAGADGDTRFLRAVDKIRDLSDGVIADGGYFSVIIADADPYFLERRASLRNRSELKNKLDGLIEDETACSFGTSDIDGALALAEDVLAENSSAKIYLYTDIDYRYVPANIEVVPMAEKGEWNLGILNATVEFSGGYYALSVDVGCYGIDVTADLNVEVLGRNHLGEDAGDMQIYTQKGIRFSADMPKTVIFSRPEDSEDASAPTDTETVEHYWFETGESFFSYTSIRIYFTMEQEDNYEYDNNFYIYGGQKETIKVQYASSDPNPFLTSALDVLVAMHREDFDVQVTPVKKGEEFATTGFDLYIFEHAMPKVMPADGVVFLFDPESAPGGSGLNIAQNYNFRDSFPLLAEKESPILRGITAEAVTVSAARLIRAGDEYDVLLSCNSLPMLLVKNDGVDKVAVMAFSVHYSNIALNPEWLLLINNLFDYFLPSTVSGSAFEVGESITLNARGPEIYFADAKEPITEFPASVTLDLPGTYTIRQQLYYGSEMSELQIYVKVPAAESEISRVDDSVYDPYSHETVNDLYDDLIYIFAAVLVAVLFIEWWLQSRGNR